MAQSGYTPIILFNSTTASNVPTTSNLAVGELAINIPDGKLYYNKSGTITVLANANYATSVSTISFGTTGLTPSTATNGVVTVAGTLAVANGGTGVANGTNNTITFTGNYTLGLTLSANTAVTLPAGATASANNLLSSATAVGIVTGTPLSTTYLRGDGTWATIAAGVSLSAANTWTATQTFNGSSSTFATTLLDANETVNIVSAAPSSTTNFYIQSGGVQYYTTSAANNWTLNIAFSSGTSLNTALSTGQSVTFTLVTTQGSTAYYNSAVTIDGTSVTPKWIGGAPTAGNASGLDVYRGSIIKTASATYTVIMSLTQFK